MKSALKKISGDLNLNVRYQVEDAPLAYEWLLTSRKAVFKDKKA